MNRHIRAIAAVYTPHLSRALAAVAVFAALCLFLYGFFLLEAVAHTASRTHAQAQIDDLSSKLSSIEETYLADTDDMTLEQATALGLVAPAEVATVYVSNPAGNLSLRTQ